MNLRSSDTSTLSANSRLRFLKLLSRRSGKTSAMATSLVGPVLTDMASPAAPVPRPPQPISATEMLLFSAAWTCGIIMPANADAAAILPEALNNSRRDRPRFVGELTTYLLILGKAGRISGWQILVSSFHGESQSIYALGNTPS